jgi:hypothetical protein
MCWINKQNNTAWNNFFLHNNRHQRCCSNWSFYFSIPFLGSVVKPIYVHLKPPWLRQKLVSRRAIQTSLTLIATWSVSLMIIMRLLMMVIWCLICKRSMGFLTMIATRGTHSFGRWMITVSTSFLFTTCSLKQAKFSWTIVETGS